ncbi:MAG: lysylphosphatidylglycerol synthase domain-containing protein [Acidobacteriota bacterium]
MTRRGALSAILSIAGVALLVWQVHVTGVATVRQGLALIGPGFFALIILLSLFRFTARSYAWTTLIGLGTPLIPAVAATISGDALGNVTPLGLMASEPAKAIYLSSHVEPRRAFAALTAENFFYSVSVAVYIMCGAAAMLGVFDVPDAVRWTGIICLVAMSVILAGAGWLAWQQPAAISAVLARVPIRRLDAIVERVREFEAQTYGSATPQDNRLLTVVATESAFHVLSFAESWLTLWLLTGSSNALQAFVLDGFSRVVNVFMKPVPFRAGVDESGSELVALAMGLNPGIGVVMGLVRKVRMIVWAAVGIGLWVRSGRKRA